MKSSSVKLYFLDVKYSPGGQVFVVLEDLLTQFVDQLVETQVDLHNKQWSKGSEVYSMLYTWSRRTKVPHISGALNEVNSGASNTLS